MGIIDNTNVSWSTKKVSKGKKSGFYVITNKSIVLDQMTFLPRKNGNPTFQQPYLLTL
jgi:hypothetical protein